MTTEEKIFLAAENEFMEKGFDGTRMQAIADRAGINKAMLHYYFRSKDALFEKIFQEKIKFIFPKIGEDVKKKKSFIEKVEVFIETYYQLLSQYPFLPLFVITTMNKKGNEHFAKNLPVDFFRDFFIASMFEEISQGKIKAVNPLQFAFSVLGMSVFPFLARPAILHVVNGNQEIFEELMKGRVEELKKYVRYILTP